MMLLLPLWLCALVAVTCGYRSVCYYTNWAQYRHGKGTFVPENVDPFLCTHLMYAFAKPQGLDIAAFEWNDESTQWSEGMYSRTIKLKEKNPALKILLAVGGYNLGSLPFLPIVDSVASRAAFAQNAIKFLREKNFDGLDLDWEYPGAGGSTAADKGKYVLLIQELRRAFEAEAQATAKERLLVTGALPAGKPTIDAGFDVPNVLQHMDFISIMTYDLHGSWEPYTGINSPLYAHTNDVGNDAHLNLHWAAQYYVALGAPKEKLNIGIALYGRSFTLDNPIHHDIGSPASQPGDAGLFTGEKGFIAYYEVCDLINSGASVVDVTSQRNRYLYKGTQWVGYDDVQSVTEKACYTKENGFGGVMFWALDLDDFSGQTCSQGTYPLIQAVNTELRNSSLGNCVSPPDGSVVTGTTQSPHTEPVVKPSIVPTSDFDCTGKSNDFFRDPNVCGNFFMCVNEIAFEVNCRDGLLYNPTTKHCEILSIISCEGQETTPAQVTSQVTHEAPATSPNTLCAGHQDGPVAHPTNCHKFFYCSSGVAQELTCQGSMVFNPALGTCDFSQCTANSVVVG